MGAQRSEPESSPCGPELFSLLARLLPQLARRLWGWLRIMRESVLGFNLSFLFSRTDLYVEVMARVLTMAGNGELGPFGDDAVTLYPLAQVADAHAAIESGMTTGKLVLDTSEELAVLVARSEGKDRETELLAFVPKI